MIRFQPHSGIVRISISTLGYDVLAVFVSQGAVHAERLEDSLAQEFAKRFAGCFLHNRGEQHVSAIAVVPFGSRRELRCGLQFHQREDVTVMDLRDLLPGLIGELLVNERFVVNQAGCVREQIANRYGFSILGKAGENGRETLVVAQFAVVNEQHHCHGRELLGERCETKVGTRIDGKLRPQIAHSVPSLENCTAILPHQHSKTGLTRQSDGGENGVDLLRPGIFGARSGRCAHKQES